MMNKVYCPGCSHPLIQRVFRDVLEANNLMDQTIGVFTEGCGKYIPANIPVDFIQSPSGRAPAVATGIKRACSDKMVFTYQGDGDITTGFNALCQAAIRGEKITVIFVNNCIEASLGGYMSLTTLVGQNTKTSPYGRSAEWFGKPVKITELIARLPGVAYAHRISLHTPESVKEAGPVIQEAIDYQLKGKGLTFIEILAMCPTKWEMSPLEAREYLIDKVIGAYPLGLYKRTVVK